MNDNPSIGAPLIERERLLAVIGALGEALEDLLLCHAGGGFVQPDDAVLDKARMAISKAKELYESNTH